MKTYSREYQKQQQELHKSPEYGQASLMFAPSIAKLIKDYNIRSISDYGAGKKRLEQHLKTHGITDIQYYPYDIAFPDYGDAKPADLVCCVDVLEHIERAFLDATLRHLRRLVINLGFFTVHCGPADKVLSDGRNAHLTQQPIEYWHKLLSKNFEVIGCVPHEWFGVGGVFLVRPKT